MSVERVNHGQDRLGLPPVGTSSERWAQIWATRPLLLWVAHRHGADADDAEDAVQEAMLRAAAHSEIPADRLQAWLVSVTVRLCMDGHRRRAKEARRWERASAQAVIQQPGQHPEEEACERSEAVWVASLAAELLPPRQVRALQLTAEGCDVKQVASKLGVKYRAAESLLARARRTLRTALTAALGVLAWTGRIPLPAVSDSVHVGLASAATAAMMVVAPPVLPADEQTGARSAPPPATAPAAPGAPSTSGQVTLPQLAMPSSSTDSPEDLPDVGPYLVTDQHGAALPTDQPAPADELIVIDKQEPARDPVVAEKPVVTETSGVAEKLGISEEPVAAEKPVVAERTAAAVQEQREGTTSCHRTAQQRSADQPTGQSVTAKQAVPDALAGPSEPGEHAMPSAPGEHAVAAGSVVPLEETVPAGQHDQAAHHQHFGQVTSQCNSSSSGAEGTPTHP